MTSVEQATTKTKGEKVALGSCFRWMRGPMTSFSIAHWNLLILLGYTVM